MEMESYSNEFEDNIKKLEELLETMQESTSEEDQLYQFLGGEIREIDGKFILMEH
jgi:hypothetical protein